MNCIVGVCPWRQLAIITFVLEGDTKDYSDCSTGRISDSSIYLCGTRVLPTWEMYHVVGGRRAKSTSRWHIGNMGKNGRQVRWREAVEGLVRDHSNFLLDTFPDTQPV